MPGHEGKIETQCPACQARYRVPGFSVGHHARCAKCRNSFLVTEIAARRNTPGPGRPPTEDDILGWLNEGADEEFIAPRPRIISGRDPVHPEPHEDVAARTASVPTSEARVPRSDAPLDSKPPPREPLHSTG